jgi:ribonuclease HI
MANRLASGRTVEKLVVNVDGGARGNPGPAAIGAVVQSAGGEVLEERGERIGTATNNVAEYRALLLGIERAAELGASELELIGDSELIVRQVKGEYKVKDATLRELHTEVKRALRPFERWSIRHVRREQNAEADRLVNQVLDGDG